MHHHGYLQYGRNNYLFQSEDIAFAMRFIKASILWEKS